MQETTKGLEPTILNHIGFRADQAEPWTMYPSFNLSLELYHLDHGLLDPVATEQVRQTGRVLVVDTS